MQHAHGRRRQELDDEIPVRDGIQAVRGERREPQQVGRVGAVDWEGRAGQGGAAQRHDVRAHPAALHALGIPREHLDIGHEMVGQQHGLGPLQVSVARDHHADVGLGQADEDALQLGQHAQDVVQRIAQVHAHVEGHLVVAAAAGVHLLGRLSHDFEQPRFDVHVDVLERVVEPETAALDFPSNLVQPLLEGFGVRLGDDAGLGQHPAVGDAAHDVIAVEPPVDIDGGGESFDDLGRLLAEPALPELFGHGASPTR